MIGKVIAMSIVQGGCGFPVLLPAAYHYLTTGEYLGQIVDDNVVPDPQIRHLLRQVNYLKNTPVTYFKHLFFCILM